MCQKLCEKLTNHKYSKLYAWEKSFEDGGFKYPNRHDFFYKCKICGLMFFNNKPSKQDIEFIKKYSKNERSRWI